MRKTGVRVLPSRRLAAAIALGLSALLGLFVPLGEGAIAPASAVEADSGVQGGAGVQDGAADASSEGDSGAGSGDSGASGDAARAETDGDASNAASPDRPGAPESPAAVREPIAPLSGIGPQAQIGWCEAPSRADSYYVLHRGSSRTNNSMDRATIFEVGIDSTAVPNRINTSATALRSDLNVSPASGGIGAQQGANALGVASDGLAYFTTQYLRNGTNRADVWRVDLTNTSSPVRVVADYQMSANDSIWEPYITSGAVRPTDGRFFFGYYSHAVATDAVQLHLFRLDGSIGGGANSGTVVPVGIFETPWGTYPGGPSGDLLFDALGNLTMMVSQNTHSDTVPSNARTFSLSREILAQAEAAGNPSAVYTGLSAGDQVQFSNNSGVIGGLAYARTGNLVLEGQDRHGLRVPVSLAPVSAPVTVSQAGAAAGQSDAASCISPPTFTLQKRIPNRRAADTDQFVLSAREDATGAATMTVTTAGTDPGVQRQGIAMTARAGTQILFRETAAPGTGTDLANYSTSYACRDIRNNPGGTLPVSTVTNGGSTWRSVQIPTGTAAAPQVECTVVNRDTVPRLSVTKTADPADGSTIGAGGDVSYTLTFDNSTGTAPAPIDYTDYLADVLDDADLLRADGAIDNANPGVATTGGVTATYERAAKSIVLGGAVAAGTVGTATFTVRAKDNADDAQNRQRGTAANAGNPGARGYRLTNFLVRGSDPIPRECAAAGTGSELCTTHQLRAWTVGKGSQPEDGAMIHIGGNIYYRVQVTNYSGQDLTGITIRDDMTQTLAAATWDPGAPQAVTRPYGVSYYTPEGVHIPAGDIDWNDPATPGPAPQFGGGAPSFDPEFPGGLPFPNRTWTLTAQIDLPATIAGQRVGYAMVGYAVEGGHVASPSDPTAPYEHGGTTVPALPAANWVNTVSTVAPTSGPNAGIESNRCSGDVPSGDVAGFYDCKTWHSLGDSYFHVWKKAADLSRGNDQVDNNLVGSTFLIADTEADARDGIPSRWLCRAENAVPNPNDVNSEPGAPVGSGAGTPQFDEGSPAHASIEAANRTRASHNLTNGYVSGEPEYRPQLEQCGLFFHLDADSEGQAAGSWRAMDLRGGDTDAAGTAPLADWRASSGYNNGVNSSGGRHGTYWLAETESPESYQLLAQPMRLWVAPNAPTPEGLAPGDPLRTDYQGRLSMPVVGLGENSVGIPGMGGATGGGALRAACVSPYRLPANNQPSCIMPTGWAMPVFDVKTPTLPFTGGDGFGLLFGGGVLVLLAALGGTLWWRRRQSEIAPLEGSE